MSAKLFLSAAGAGPSANAIMGTCTPYTLASTAATASTLAVSALSDLAVTALGTSVPIAASVAMTAAQAGALCPVTQGVAAVVITLPAPSAGMVGASYRFVIVAAGVANVTVASVGAVLFGTIINGATGATASTILGSGTTITFTGGQSAVGDSLEVVYISATQIHVRGITSAATGMSVA